jgi:hypothetical protein
MLHARVRIPEAIMRNISSSRRVAPVAVLAVLLCGPALADTPANASAPVSAVWTPKELRFVFMGFTSHYSCDGLADVMRKVLLLLGAGKDLKVSPTPCTTPFGRPDPFPGVTVKMNVLVPASATSATSDATNTGNAADYRRAMAACLDARGYSAQWAQSRAQVFVYPRNGQSEAQTQSDRSECHRWAVSQSGYDPTHPAPQSSGSAGGGSTAAQPVPAHWKMIDVNAAMARDPLWQAGQCELVEQIKQSVLPKFTTRNVQYQSTCVPNQLYLGATQLRAEVLVADEQNAPAPAAAAR